MVLKQIIAKNIMELRTCAKLSRAELAASFSLTEGDVELWESGEVTPDVIVLKGLADRFGVSVDYLLTRTHRSGSYEDFSPAALRRRLHAMIAVLAFLSVWILATLACAFILIFEISVLPFWMPFVYAVPLAFITLVVFNSLWGELRFNIIFSSLILWGLIASTYFSLLFFLDSSVWAIFLIGIPLEIALCFIPCTGVVNYTFFTGRGVEK